MKTEYIIAYQNSWYHFFIKPNLGFCVGKKTGALFVHNEVLLANPFEDFCVTKTDKFIHAVCQDSFGSIICFIFDGNEWKSKTILESRDKKAEFKNLKLFAMGNFINLFYVVNTKEGQILVHQILGENNSLPKAVDFICGNEFSVCECKTSDLVLLYKNRENEIGTRTFSWSKKSFGDFSELECNCDLEHPEIMCDKNDVLNIVGFASFDKFVNILHFTKSNFTYENKISAVHLVSGEADGLCISNYGNRKTISWCENGLVMTSSYGENKKWSAPKKYIKGTSQKNVIYNIKTGTESFSVYGYRQDGKIIFYIPCDILNNPPEDLSKKAGSESLEKKTLHQVQYVKLSKYLDDLSSLTKKISDLENKLNVLSKKISASEKADKVADLICEEPDQIDKLAAENSAKEHQI